MSEITFYLDENVSSALAVALRRRNIKVMTVVDADLRMAGDDAHMAYANEHRLVIVTQDDDFLALAAVEPDHRGVVYAPQGTSIGALVKGLTLIWSVCTAADMFGRVEYI
jgi:MinD-like ATPase involved in chromosome partitioning or flagellar assembly